MNKLPCSNPVIEAPRGFVQRPIGRTQETHPLKKLSQKVSYKRAFAYSSPGVVYTRKEHGMRASPPRSITFFAIAAFTILAANGIFTYSIIVGLPTASHSSLRNEVPIAALTIGVATLANLFLTFLTYYLIRRERMGRQVAASEIQQSRRMLQLVLDHVPQRVFWKDLNSRFLGCNKALLQDCGLSDTNEIIGKTDFELPWKGRAENYRADDLAVMTSNTPKRDFEEYLVRADGAQLWRRTTKIPLHAEDGQVIGVLGTFEDITEQKRSEVALRKSEARFRTLWETTTDAVVILDANYVIRYANPSVNEVTGYKPEELVDHELSMLQPVTTRDVLWEEMKHYRSTGKRKLNWRGAELMALHKDGHEFPIEASFTELNLDGETIFVAFVRDITNRKRSEAAVRLRDRAIESSINAIFITDHLAPDEPLIYVNPAFERITQYSMADMLGRNCRFLQGKDRDQPEIEALREAVIAEREVQVILRNYRKDGSLFWNDLRIAPVRNEAGKVTHFVGILNDISENKHYQQELEHQANYDKLTGLPNRNLLSDRLDRAILNAVRHRTRFAVAFIDLDGFKDINDSLGHGAGDRLLKAVAQRLVSALRATDTVARLGGDEFVLILGDQSEGKQLASELQRVLEIIAQPLTIDNSEIYVTASIGASVYPSDGQTGSALLKNADTAMYRAKDHGKNTVQCYSAEMNDEVSERLSLQVNLRRALEREEFLLHYQPQVDLRTGRMVGAEALIRWRHPELGMVSPGKFIPIAEACGLIEPIGEWVIKTACAQNKAWQDAGLPRLHVSVNLSTRQFRGKGLIEWVSRVLLETGLEAKYLELELTESVIMHNAEHVIATVRDLKNLGLQLSIDDFGTGYSSLSYLKRFPVDRLKIDQSFIRDLGTDPDDAAIARTVIALAKSLDLRVIAEGVETAEQLAFLSLHDCDEVQGYYFSRPVPAEEFVRLLEKGGVLSPG